MKNLLMASTDDAGARQTSESVTKNIAFFREDRQGYRRNVQALDTYVTIRACVNDALAGVHRLLDVGNGGVFDYDVGLVPEIVALDLFVDEARAALFPPHVRFRAGSALCVPEPDESFDGVLMVMLLHHLVGATESRSRDNVGLALAEAFRVLRPGGKLIVIESCVPRWFYSLERLVFPVASAAINFTMKHPSTLQYPAEAIVKMLEEHAKEVRATRIPKGRWVLQYGFKFPAALTPVVPWRFVAHKPGSPRQDSPAPP